MLRALSSTPLPLHPVKTIQFCASKCKCQVQRSEIDLRAYNGNSAFAALVLNCADVNAKLWSSVEDIFVKWL